MFDAWDTAAEISLARRGDRWPRNPDSCFKFNSVCPFYEVCANGLQIESSGEFTRLENVHSELKGAPLYLENLKGEPE
jgi:hypothetical protein